MNLSIDKIQGTICPKGDKILEQNDA